MMARKVPAVMAPAGSPEALSAALKAGADAVYFGVGSMNMRGGAAVNFAEADLPEVVAKIHRAGALAYLTLNIIVYDREMAEVERLCAAAKAAGVDAVIASDWAVILCCRRHGLAVHVSVQANVSNTESLRFYARYAELVVVARELNLAQVRAITADVERERITAPSGELVKTELFVHGALCSSVSGKCYFSLTAYNASANRGACLQNCRRRYRVTELETGNALEVANGYVFSASDLCMVRFIPEIAESGVDVLKIEGRGRSADYVYTVTRVYKEALEAWAAGAFSPEKAAVWLERLRGVFNRGFWEGGYYLGEEFGEWAGCGGNQSPTVKTQVGRVERYYAKAGAASIRLQSGELRDGDRLLIIGETTGAVEFTANGVREEDAPTGHARKGTLATLATPERVRANDKVYVLTLRKFGYPSEE